MTELPEPEAFSHRHGKHVAQYRTLVARKGREFVFLDKVFSSGDLNDSPLRGATSTTMMPIYTQEELDRREIPYDDSYEARYGPDVRDKTDEELAAVECVGGGRAFTDAERDYDEVYRPDLLELMQEAEADEADLWDGFTDTVEAEA